MPLLLPSALFPYTTLFRSAAALVPDFPERPVELAAEQPAVAAVQEEPGIAPPAPAWEAAAQPRSEEHTSELQSRLHLVCRLLLEKKKKWTHIWIEGGLSCR